jgi:hypothetical protein
MPRANPRGATGGVGSTGRAGEQASPGSGRPVPRPFEFHWGRGQIVEEASYTGRYTEPAIQLLEYEGTKGAYGIRFCYYNHDGRFQRSPMMIDSEDSLGGLRAALKHTPKLRALLRKLAS